METITPQQKAKELTNKFYYSHLTMNADMAKECALIAIDEILKIVNPILAAFETESDGYWESVKEEIKKL